MTSVSYKKHKLVLVGHLRACLRNLSSSMLEGIAVLLNVVMVGQPRVDQAQLQLKAVEHCSLGELVLQEVQHGLGCGTAF